MQSPTARLTHDQIRGVTNGRAKNERQCPVCDHWHLLLYGTDDFDCKNECSERDVAKELYRRLGISGYRPPEATPPASGNGEAPRLGGPLTVKEYAAAKRLDEEWLLDGWDLFDTTYTGVAAVGFPYDGDRKLVKYRGTKSETNKCDKLWPAGAKTTLYGLPVLRAQFLAFAHFGGYKAVPPYLFIVEGESDTHTMMWNGLPTLGVSGQGIWKPEWCDEPLINEAQLIFNIQEPDDPSLPHEQWTWVKADKWTKKIADNLPGIEVRAVRLTMKDASALWLDMDELHGWEGDDFVKEAFNDAISTACKRESSILVSAPTKPTEQVPSFEMPETVLCGRLGELLTKNLSRLPLAFSWLSLVAIAGVLVPSGDESTSLYVANVGPSGSGKDTTVTFCLKMLGLEQNDGEQSLVFTTLAGSFEGFAKHYGNRMGAPGLWFSPELIHTLGKSKIEGASYIPALCQLYDSSKTSVVMAKKERVDLSIRLSIVGGLVDGNFADAFGGQTGFGLYQRFLFGLQQNKQLDYEPYTGELATRPELQSVAVASSAREALNALKVSNPDIEKRMLQNILRVAVICAAWDGRSVLTGDDMAPHLALADYQTKVRLVLRPDPGRNQMAQACNRILAYLQRHGGDVLATKLNRDTNVSKEFGPGMQHQAISQLAAAGDIEIVNKSPLVIRSAAVK